MCLSFYVEFGSLCVNSLHTGFLLVMIVLIHSVMAPSYNLGSKYRHRHKCASFDIL